MPRCHISADLLDGLVLLGGELERKDGPDLLIEGFICLERLCIGIPKLPTPHDNLRGKGEALLEGQPCPRAIPADLPVLARVEIQAIISRTALW